MYVRDIPDEDLQEAIGTCLNDRAYRVFTAAVRLLTEKGLIDQKIGEISVCVCAGFATLPPEVDPNGILGVQVDSSPVTIRNEWFSYHLNGPGDEGYTPVGFADILGNNFCTIREPDRPVKLVTKIYSASDANKKFRVYGFAANGDRIHTAGPDGRKADGFFVPTMFGQSSANSAASPIVKIDGLWKERTTDFVDLLAVDPDTNEAISLLGRYRPDETTPQYTRIRVPAENVVRVKFRRRDMVVRSADDWINLDDPEAFLLACKAVIKRRAEQFDVARLLEAEASRMIKQAMMSRQPAGIAPQNVIVDAAGLSPGKQGLYYAG